MEIAATNRAQPKIGETRFACMEKAKLLCVCVVRVLPGFETMMFLRQAHTKGCPARDV